MGRLRKGWYERQEVSRINLDWVKMNCKNITTREMKLLEIVEKRKLIRRDHLELLHPDYRKNKYSTNVLNRSLSKLFESHCIDKIHEQQELMKGNTPAIISLDRAGAILLNEQRIINNDEVKPFKLRIKHYEKKIHGEIMTFRTLPTNFPHIHAVNELEIETRKLCGLYGCNRLFWYLEEENLKKFKFNGEWVILKPDVFVIIIHNDKPILFFIEYDTGSEDFRYKTNFPTLKKKLEKYYHYKLTGIWTKEKWAKIIDTDFPLLLFVTEDKKRIKYLRDKGVEFRLDIEVLLKNDYNKLLSYIIQHN